MRQAVSIDAFRRENLVTKAEEEEDKFGCVVVIGRISGEMWTGFVFYVSNFSEGTMCGGL